jgi:uncharacterized membrane protein (UPF0182 family)
LGIIVARASIDPWTIVSYLGAARAGSVANAWRDPSFGNTLGFYFFELPLYSSLLGFVLGVTAVSAVIFVIASTAVPLIRRASQWRGDQPPVLSLDDVDLSNALSSRLLQFLIATLLLVVATRATFYRYNYLHEDHRFLVGIDYIAQNVRIPLLWLSIVCLCVAAVLVLLGRFKLSGVALVGAVLPLVVPPIVSAVYVKPNELNLQRPFIQRHIEATRSAWGLGQKLKETQHTATMDARIDPTRNRALLDNVRLWDWRAFHDTVTQIQALRQYYVFNDTDVDRYIIDGSLRQVMLTPRELDIRQLPDARANWINGHFIYTHGYGLVMAEANRITPQGQPVLFVQDAPPRVSTQSLKLTRPEIYYGEIVHEPIFVRSKQPEFNYPAGSENVQTRYEGRGGIPIGSFGMRLATAIAYADRNVLLTSLFNADSRMIIHRDIKSRLRKLANFIDWDPDPYLVVTAEGRLVWIADGYTNSSLHPYSRRIRIGELGVANYIRNSVKAVVDAYDGSVQLFVFDDTDPIIRAFRGMFPELFQPASAMPADIRSHVRYPELLLRGQAEIYRTFHMRDPEAFYNREDVWDIGKNIYAQNDQPEPLPPTYSVGTVPGSTTPEFLLIIPFTPRNKDNLIGVMIARSDGENLGELVVLQLSKQSLIYGPLQIEARIGSDQNISKDLSLWNQQGSQVLRGQMLVLPIDETFLFVEPIYIQSAQAKMPQLKKVALAVGNTLIYRDTYEEALAELNAGASRAAAASKEKGEVPPGTAPSPPAEVATSTPPPSTAQPSADPRLQAIRDHLRRYRELSSQGKWAEAGRELEQLERAAAR